MPKLAPFFIPTQAKDQGFTFRTNTDSKMDTSLNSDDSKFKSVATNLFLSDFATKLENSSKDEDCKCQLKNLLN